MAGFRRWAVILLDPGAMVRGGGRLTLRNHDASGLNIHAVLPEQPR